MCNTHLHNNNFLKPFVVSRHINRILLLWFPSPYLLLCLLFLPLSFIFLVFFPLPPLCRSRSFPPCLSVAVSLSQGFPSASNTSWRWMTGQKDFSQMQDTGDEPQLLTVSLTLSLSLCHTLKYRWCHTLRSPFSLSFSQPHCSFAYHNFSVHVPVCVSVCVC